MMVLDGNLSAYCVVISYYGHKTKYWIKTPDPSKIYLNF